MKYSFTDMSPNMKSIVVPVSFDASSINAARYAADMAWALQAEIHLVHVLEPVMAVSQMPVPESVYEELQGSSLTLLQSLSDELVRRTNGKVSVYTDLETGGIEEKLREFCDWKKPFFVVMGASRDSVEKVVEGNHTASASRMLSYPLLVIPEKAVFQGIRRIVLACDREDIHSGKPPAFSFLQELCGLLKARLEVIHVLPEEGGNEQEARTAYDSWKDKSQAPAPALHFIHESSVDEGINEYLKGHEADWLIVFPKSHGWLTFHKSQASRIITHCVLPVVSLHE